MNEKIINISELKKSFSGFKALQGINLQVEKGEIVGLLGPNGAGKSTTIKILTGLLNSDSGTVEIMGAEINKGIPVWIKEKIAVVFEESNLYIRLNAMDNLKLFAGINNINNEKIEALLSEFELQDVSKKEVRNFSKGMKKRLMICRALLSDPEILILDEATGGLDPISAEIIRKKVLDFKKEDKTVVLSTHYLEEADRLCDRVAFINEGRVIAVDKPSAFKNNLKEKHLEIKFINNQNIKNSDLKKYLEKILTEADYYSLDSEIIILRLKINQDLFKKAAFVSKKLKLIDFNKNEADLQQVFKNLNN
ncbi:ABC transporter ATP-binding protein [Halanaerobium saccharolyticum]|nr:ABC transporter ATP-binding protein [Halanaerobium saccharolyticum]